MKRDHRQVVISRSRQPRSRRGLGLVEVLICASIGAMILTAVAIAFRASFNSYKDNQQRGQLLNSARGCIYEMTEDIRMCDLALPYDSNAAISSAEYNQFTTQAIVPGNPTTGLPSAGGTGVAGISLRKTHKDSHDPTADTNPVTFIYKYDPTQQEILMTRTYDNGTSVGPFVMCKFVQSMQIYMLPQPGSVGNLQSATVTITLANRDATGGRILADANQDLTLVITDAAVPRRLFPGI
jgi:hypothetical protein